MDVGPKVGSKFGNPLSVLCFALFGAMMPETVLTLIDIDRILRELEQLHGCTTEEFLRNAERRAELSEDVIFEWEAMLDHKKALEDEQSDVHRGYLSALHPGNDEATRPRERQALLAA